MAPSYTAWCQEYLPDATIVYDHFHVIKLANEKLDLVRRNEVNKAKEVDKIEEGIINSYCQELTERALNRKIPQVKINKRVKQIKKRFESSARFIKGTKWILLKNAENLTNADAQVSLAILQESNQNLALAYQLKEQLRVVYQAQNIDDARVELEIWCKLADKSGLRPMITMAHKTSLRIPG